MAGCDYITENASEEQSRLIEKIDVLARGEFREGDFPKLFRCALYLLQCGGAVAGAAFSSTPKEIAAWAAVALATILKDLRDCTKDENLRDRILKLEKELEAMKKSHS
jgi:hypothetical protein